MEQEYSRRTRRSLQLFRRAKKVFAGGVSHNARLYSPYPIFVSRAVGKSIWDEDGNEYTDYWMGHTALILGHSPSVVVRALRAQAGRGTLYGMGSKASVELAEEVQRDVPCAELMRFCNTGAEASTYLVRLARAYTGKRTVIKMRGGWHGYGTALNLDVHPPYDGAEGSGILPEEQAHVRSVRFNDIQEAERAVREEGDDVAAIFLEPVLGAGGCIPADREYLRALRELADGAGALLAFDEVITGFRLGLGGAQEAYGVVPDLATFGKVAGGGMPFGMVCGSKEVMSRADPSLGRGSASVGGGTFSENPMTMEAGLATLRYLRRNRARVYERLRSEGLALRSGVDRAFGECGVESHTAGDGSLFATHFGPAPKCPEDITRASRESTVAFGLFLVSNGVFVLPGHPSAISTAHSPRDIGRVEELARGFAAAQRVRQSQNGEAKVTS